MTKEQRRVEIEKCLDLVEKLDVAWEGWRELGVEVEAPFPDAAWRISSAYVDLLEERHGLEECLTWWIYEHPTDGDASEINVEGRSYTLKTRADLLDYLDAEYPVKDQA